MGLDSLMGVELMIALETRFGIRLPVMALSQSPSIAKLAERVIQQLRGNEEGSEESSDAQARRGIVAQAEQVARQQGVEASAESIASLADDIQSAAGAARRWPEERLTWHARAYQG
jgi:phthiocerol/phenolphthiocerol synthesis type-I polyketide synthase C